VSTRIRCVGQRDEGGPVGASVIELRQGASTASGGPGRSPAAAGSLRLTVLVAAHDAEGSIGAALDSLAAQSRLPDRTVVVADNCSDATVSTSFQTRFPTRSPLLVYYTDRNDLKRPGALNQAWAVTRPFTDLFVCIDADTVLPTNALRDWEQEFLADTTLGECRAKFTMPTPQERTVPGGTARAFRASALDEVVAIRRRQGEELRPWAYLSAVEDFELTVRLRQLGYACKVSATVRASRCVPRRQETAPVGASIIELRPGASTASGGPRRSAPALAPLRLTVLIAAHNEEASIGATLDSLAAQSRLPDRTVVVADNCSDATVATSFQTRFPKRSPLLVYYTDSNDQKKPGALNQAWAVTRAFTDLFICIDADTVLPTNALRDWEQEFLADPILAGCSAKFTMLSPQERRLLARDKIIPPSAGAFPDFSFRQRLWCRVQKAEFSRWTDTALARKQRWTSVLAGTACAIRASALDEVVAVRRRQGEEPLPWAYSSEVEDFELTLRLRELGYMCRVSATVRAYTDAMLNLKALWAQRLKWQVGTVRVLTSVGLNKLTALDWWQQAVGLVAALIRVAWVTLLFLGIFFTGSVHLFRFWWIFPVTFAVVDLREVWRVPHRTMADLVTAVCLIPQEVFAWLRAGWFMWSWVEVLTGRRRDRWMIQIAAEGG
jgi:poly-beta-1,6-N-acetyl-D-glucosamine synthase